jgi:hypothetical protein
MPDVKIWQQKIHEAHDIMSDDGAHPMRYIVGRQGATLAESVLSVSLNEAAALLSVGDRWDSEKVIQVLDVSTWTLYVFDTDCRRMPTRLADADETSPRWCRRRGSGRGRRRSIHERAGEDDSKGAPWES